MQEGSLIGGVHNKALQNPEPIVPQRGMVTAGMGRARNYNLLHSLVGPMVGNLTSHKHTITFGDPYGGTK